MDNDFEIFKGKTYSSLIQDIYESSMNRRNQVELLVSDLRVFIKGAGDIPIIVPFIKEYLDVANKNDENLVKLATALGRIVLSTSAKEGDSNWLSDDERRQLMGEVEKNIKFGDNEVEQKLVSVNKKVTLIKDK